MNIKDNVPGITKPGSQQETDAAEKQSRSSLIRTIILILGDALVFFIFATVGRRSHGEIAGLDGLLQTALTAAPFAAGWFVLAPFVGAYRGTTVMQPRKMFRRTLFAWLGGWPIGLLLRGLFVDHAVPPAIFAVITLVSNIIFLFIWRGLFLVGYNLFARSRK